MLFTNAHCAFLRQLPKHQGAAGAVTQNPARFLIYSDHVEPHIWPQRNPVTSSSQSLLSHHGAEDKKWPWRGKGETLTEFLKSKRRETVAK